MLEAVTKWWHDKTKAQAARAKSRETAHTRAEQLFDHGPGKHDAAYEIVPDPEVANQFLVFTPESMAAVYPNFPTAYDYVIRVKRDRATGELVYTCSCQFFRTEEKIDPPGFCKHTEGLILAVARFMPIIERIQDLEMTLGFDGAAPEPVRPNVYSTARNTSEVGAIGCHLPLLGSRTPGGDSIATSETQTDSENPRLLRLGDREHDLCLPEAPL